MISGIILAAGKSSRMGQDKLALMLDDKSILEHVIFAAKESKLDEVVLVWGKYENSRNLACKHGLLPVENRDYEKGLSTSIIAGLQRISPQWEAVVFLLGDMPFVKASTINGLIDAYHHTFKGIVVPVYGGQRGNPVLFSRRYERELYGLKGDRGGRSLISSHAAEVTEVFFEETEEAVDIDTMDIYGAYQKGDLCENKKSEA